jgi:hypothetical protein
MKKVYYSKDFKGKWPVGTAALIVANDEEEARTLLKAKAQELGLPGDDKFTVHRVSRAEVGVIILHDGDY